MNQLSRIVLVARRMGPTWRALLTLALAGIAAAGIMAPSEIDIP